MQGDEGMVDAAFGKRCQKRFGKVEAGRRRGDGAALPRIDRLVVDPVFRPRRVPRNVGRQRHLAGSLQRIEHARRAGVERQQEIPAVPFFENRRVGQAGAADGVARPEPFARARKGQPPRPGVIFARHLSMQRNLDTGLAARRRPDAAQPRRDDPGIVHDQKIAGAQQIRQVADSPVCRIRTDMQQPRRIPRPRRRLGDPVFRQGKIEFVDAHRASGGGRIGSTGLPVGTGQELAFARERGSGPYRRFFRAPAARPD